MNNIVWEELSMGESINSFRRELQSHHLNLIIKIYKDSKFPIDAQNLALESIQKIYRTINNQNIKDIYDNYTQVHLINIKTKIELALDLKKCS